MKKFLQIALLFISTQLFAGGGLTHMFIAEESIAQISNPILQHILQNNFDSYLVGAYYPDSGYVKGTHYGEDSHWDKFIYTFAEYIKDTYPNLSNPRLIAFLFGCAAHRESDEIMHWTFYPEVAKYDFDGDYQKAHQLADPGIDILLNVEHFIRTPHTWWIPVKDLVEVYHRMHKDEYTEQEIRLGTSVIHAANKMEKHMGRNSYHSFIKKMPWTATHYYDWIEGGILMDIQKVANYQNQLWEYLVQSNTYR
ncbi:MAG TPA: zinc dependent phospholipase C family protein [Gammaproteobacteria bacterium]|jgi:hypothetical protein|nr:zinc dependent phospholipase C family protein [Gammaproteobacteria bacterium]